MKQQMVFCRFDEAGYPIDYFLVGNLRPNCDRFDPITGEPEDLKNKIEQMSKAGYRYVSLNEVLRLQAENK